MTHVLDCSVLARLVLVEPGSAAIKAWHATAVARGGLAAPRILHWELGQVLARTMQAPPAELAALHGALLGGIRLADPPALAVFEAVRHGLTFYDAAYLALARSEGSTLVTADKDMMRAARSWKVAVQEF